MTSSVNGATGVTGIGQQVAQPTSVDASQQVQQVPPGGPSGSMQTQACSSCGCCCCCCASNGAPTTYDATPVADSSGGGLTGAATDPGTPPAPVDSSATAAATDPTDGTTSGAATTTTNSPSQPPAPLSVGAAAVSTNVADAPATQNPVDAPVDSTAPATPGAGSGVPGTDTSAASSSDDANAPATAPANQLSDWDQWNAAFAGLGVPATDIAQIGAQALSEHQLAETYMTIRQQLADNGSTPAASDNAPPTSDSATGATGQASSTALDPSQLPKTGGWSNDWVQAFEQLGIDDSDIQAAEQQYPQATDADLTQLYEQAAQQLASGADGSASTDGSAAADSSQNAWNSQWQAKFQKLGVPDDVIGMYAQGGSSTAGLQYAYKHASDQLASYKKDGWYQKLQAAGATPDIIWQTMLEQPQPTDKELQQLVDQTKLSNEGLARKGAQVALNLVPGFDAVQYAFGNNFVTGTSKKQLGPLAIGGAVASVASVPIAIRGIRNISAGRAAARGIVAGTSALAKIGNGEISPELMAQAQRATGALSYVPFTPAHRAATGIGTVESAARSFTDGGAEKIAAQGDVGATTSAIVGQTLNDIKDGKVSVQGSGNAYIGRFARMPFSAAKSPVSVSANGKTISLASNVHVANADESLGLMSNAAGDRLVSNAAFSDALKGVSANELSALGTATGGTASAGLGLDQASHGAQAVIGKIAPGSTEYLAKIGLNSASGAETIAKIGTRMGGATDAAADGAAELAHQLALFEHVR